jgi:hypothetical protein
MTRQIRASKVPKAGFSKKSLFFSLFSVRHRALPDLQVMKAGFYMW